MINQNLHKNPVPLDSAQHRGLRLALPVTDWTPAARLNAIFVCATEFADAGREFPLVFVRAGKNEQGQEEIAPIAVLGLLQEQNLYQSGGRWRANYMPAVLRSYPFCIGRLDAQRFAVCVDMAWSGVRNDGAGEGQALFDANGQPVELLKDMQKHFEVLEAEIQRTRAVCSRLIELDVLRDMQLDATLPDGRKHRVDGFLTVDQEKMQNLPDNVVVELHKSGMLGMIHLHWASLGVVRRLLDWHIERSAAQSVPAPAQVS